LSGEWKPEIHSADNHSPDPVACRSPRPESEINRIPFETPHDVSYKGKNSADHFDPRREFVRLSF
jgi:hypothetical protein